MKPKRITSHSNTAVKEAARLKRKRNRYAVRLFLVEGEDLLDAALRRLIMPRQVFVLEGHEEPAGKALAEALATGGESRRGRQPRAEAPEFYAVSQPVMAKLSELGSGSRVISVFALQEPRLPDAPPAAAGTGGAAGEETAAGPLVFLAGAGDPGNVGTAIRSAAALGASGVILDPETADPYSPKALRATMGSVFNIPVYLNVAAGELVAWAVGLGLKIVAADAHRGMAPWEADLSGGFVLALGAERGGLSGRLKAAAQEIVHIPQVSAAESVNVAQSGSILLYEALRQRKC